MINILYNGRIIYHHIDYEEVPALLLQLAQDEEIDQNQIEIEEI
jgi:hypothetical protein